MVRGREAAPNRNEQRGTGSILTEAEEEDVMVPFR